MRSVRIACQRSAWPAQGFGSHVLARYFTCGETRATDPDLYGSVPAGLFFQLVAIFIMLIFVFIFDGFFFFLLQRNKFCQIIHQNATKSDRVVLPNRRWLVQPNRTLLCEVRLKKTRLRKGKLLLCYKTFTLRKHLRLHWQYILLPARLKKFV